MRISLFEFEDLKWFPGAVRSGMTDYLRYLFSMFKIYDGATALLDEVMTKAGVDEITDLCSGGGGPVERLAELLSRKRSGLKATLTDLYPNTEAYELVKTRSKGRVDYCSAPVDAANVPPQLRGVRTMFSAFHHFSPEKAKAVLKDAVDKKAPVAIFDGGDKNLLSISGILFFHPLAFLFLTPFFRPFRFSRIVFTYIMPLIPLCTVWDGLVSILRLYSPGEMLKLAQSVDAETYQWDAGKLKSKSGFKVAYLVGWPKKEA